MASVYKIHPAIGIARVGDSPVQFFIGPELPGHAGIELTGATETPVTSFKSNGKVKCQAARFRVFEYTQGANGSLTLVGEVANATIEWKVELVNRKAAGPKILGAGGMRNSAIADRDSLIIRDPRERKISGANQPPVPIDQGTFLGKPVYLGELRTDSEGRLIVLGGRGASEGIPAGPGQPIPPLPSFDNNDRWHDDVGDGPVTATVTVDGKSRAVDSPAWVVVGPPDFAPGLGGIVTLFDVALQAAIDRNWLQAPAVPSFRWNIQPTLARAFGLRWVHNFQRWDDMPHDWAKLSDKSDPANANIRSQVFQLVTNPGLNNAEYPEFLIGLLDKWVAGNFIDDWNTAVSAPMLTPETLDRAALDACIGLNFFPGIEAGSIMKDSSLYAEPIRFSHQAVKAGGCTEVMALPWQADFHDCSDDWWPSQRPNDVFVNTADIPLNPVQWSAGIQGPGGPGRLRMVKGFSRLGFILPVSDQVDSAYVEVDRDPTLPGR